MTGYTVNTGATTKFSQNWDRIFSGGRAATGKKAAAPAKPATEAAVKPAARAAAKPVATKTTGAKTVKSKKASQQALTSGKR